MGWKGLIIAALLLLTMVPSAGAEVPGWTVDLSDHAPYLGDTVVFEVNTTAQLAYMNVNIKVLGPNGVRVLSDFFTLDLFGYGRYYWETSLYADPGVYCVVLTFADLELAQFDVDLVYDELDFLSKRLVLLEEELESSRRFERATREKTDKLDLRMEAYIDKWGFLLTMLFIVSMVFYNRRSIYGALPPNSGTRSALKAIFTRHSDGVFTHPDYIKEVPEGARMYCMACRAFVPRGHVHGAKRRVRPLRVPREVE